MSRSCEEDPAFDYILTLFLEATAQPLTVLPTHRICVVLATRPSPRCWPGLTSWFEVRRGIEADELVGHLIPSRLPRAGPVASDSGRGRAVPCFRHDARPSNHFSPTAEPRCEPRRDAPRRPSIVWPGSTRLR